MNLPAEEKAVILVYLLNLAGHPVCRRELLGEICEFIVHFPQLLDPLRPAERKKLTTVQDFSESYEHAACPREEVDAARTALLALLTPRRVPAKDVELPGVFQRNLDTLAHDLGLDAIENAFMGLLSRYQGWRGLRCFIDNANGKFGDPVGLCAIFLAVDEMELAQRLRPESRLLSSGIVTQEDCQGSDLDDHYSLIKNVESALYKCRTLGSDLRSLILGAPRQATLSWENFRHLGETRDRLREFLRRALDEGLPGVNILFYGPPGTGKTEFCKTLAQELAVPLYAVGEVDDAGHEPNRHERIQSLELAQMILGSKGRGLLLFDEMDDVMGGEFNFFGKRRSTGPKIFLHRMLENNPVPTFWILNDVSNLDEAIVRRMALAIELKSPPVASRRQVWEQVLERHELALPDAEIRQLVKLDIAPAVIDSATRFARCLNGSSDDLRFAATSIIRAMNKGVSPPLETVVDAYRPELTCSSLDVEALAGRLSASDEKRFSLCLYGPPGTGKSALVRYLAQRLDMPVLLKRASDLLDPYVGMTEQKIAKAFAEALDLGAFLVFDEADSLLSDRRHAARNWEVSQVNEMLTWMESHALPFACTTNLREHLDPASLRRFTFKCHLDYLQPAQVEPAFRYFFPEAELPAGLVALHGLTPGDFAVVARKARVMGCLNDAGKLHGLLSEEIREKGLSAQSSAKIGFLN